MLADTTHSASRHERLCSSTALSRIVCHREQGDAGGYAAIGIASTSRSMSGYQRLKMAPSSPLSVRTRVCNNKCAPSLDHFIHRRLHKPGRDCLALTIALTVIRDQEPVVHDVRAQLRQRLDPLREPGIGLPEGLHRSFQVINLAQRFVDLTVPQ